VICFFSTRINKQAKRIFDQEETEHFIYLFNMIMMIGVSLSVENEFIAN
jgi:hypothetical protein